MLLRVNADHPQPRSISKAADLLGEGGVIIYPTDTAYGLGCSIFSKRSIERVYTIKGKAKREPLSFVCADLKDLDRYAIVTDASYRILRRYLPGPYTFVLKASNLVPKIMLTKRRTVGIRVPNNAVALALVAALGSPIVSTSVEPGEGLMNDPEDIHSRFGKMVDLVIDAGVIPYQMSSVIDLTSDEPVVLREGIGEIADFM